MGKVRKGMFFTISVVLLSTAFLYLLASVSLYSNSLKATAASLIELERLNVHTDDVAHQIKSILLSGGLDITITRPEHVLVTFEEHVPPAGNYYVDLTNFRDFAETQSPFNTSINITEARIPKLYINPYNITASHHIGEMMFTPEDTDSADNVISYNISIIIGEEILWMNWTNITEVSDSDPDALFFHLGLQGTNGAVSTNKYLDKYNSTELRLLDSKNRTKFVIQIDSPAALTVHYNMEAYLKTEIYLNNVGEDTSVELGRSIISTRSESPEGSEKTLGVILYES